MQRHSPAISAQLQRLNEVLLSLNLALVALYYYVVRSFIAAGYSMGTNDAYNARYYFFRAAVRLNRLLHYQPSGLERYDQWPNAGGRLGVELAFGLTTVFIGVLFLTILCSARNFRYYINVLRSVSGLIFILGFPATYVLLFDRGIIALASMQLWWPVAIAELICAAVLCLIYLLRPFSGWAMGIMLLLNYCFWALVYSSGNGGYTLYGRIPPRLLLLLIPVGGSVWLYYCQVSRREPRKPSTKLAEKVGWTPLLAAVVVSLAGLGALW